VKESVLDPGNRAALQALVSLAGVVGLGALLSGAVLHRVGLRHRDAGFAAFEVFVVVAALMAAIATATLGLTFLSRGEAISGTDLFRISTPLLVSLVLLVLLTSAARFLTAAGDLSANFPIYLATLFAAIVVGIAPVFVAPDPADIMGLVAGILVAGLLIGWAFLLLERRSLRSNRRNAQRRLAKLSIEGFLPVQRALRAMIPTADINPEVQVVCWTYKGKLYLDQSEARRLCRIVDESWADLLEGRALPSLDETVLSGCALKTTVFPWPPKFTMVVNLRSRDASEPDIHDLRVNEHGLFDVTDLQIFAGV
jgi:hypothetical protein